MQSRRNFVKNSLKGTALLAFGSTVPSFLASTASAATTGKEKILVLVELTGGNDGLNTVVPFGDDLYHKARPKIGVKEEALVKIDDHAGLHGAMRPLEPMLKNGQVSVLPGIGYPNPNRSHFESMDVWHTADPTRKSQDGWLGRSISSLKLQEGRVPAFHISKEQLPLALQGSGIGIPTIHSDKPFDLDFTGDPQPRTQRTQLNPFGTAPGKLLSTIDVKSETYQQRKALISELADLDWNPENDAYQFVRRTSLNTYTAIDQLREIIHGEFTTPQAQYEQVGRAYLPVREGLGYELLLAARMIAADFGTRIYYLSISGFDTHSAQQSTHQQLLQKVATAISQFYLQLAKSRDAERVLLVTYSEFGRRVSENNSQGTDHGAGSCMLAFGPAVKGGVVGKHPSLVADQLTEGDLKYHTDFRQVYATILDKWLDCDRRRVLGEKFEHIDFLRS